MATRRNVLMGLGAATAGFAMPAYLRNRRAIALETKQWPLPIPPLERGRVENGVRVFDLQLRKGNSQFYPGFNTPTLGVNAEYLGPTLHFKNGETVRLNVENAIGEPTTLHWHGLHLPALADGGPHQIVEAGQTWSPSFTVKQAASLFWYHPHLLHKTGLHAYYGMAGGILVDDEHSAGLDLPKTYGVDDIPVILQDKRFNKDGTLQYTRAMHDRMMGFKGDVLLVNGAISPNFKATTQKVRLRIVNASNARFYTLGLSDGRGFKVVGGDGSLLPAPVDAARVVIAPGERIDIVVDISDLKGGQAISLKSFGYEETGNTAGGMGRGMGMGGMGRGMGQGMGQGMGMGRMMRMMSDDGRQFDVLTVTADANLRSSPEIPTRLADLPKLDPSSASVTRRFSLEMVMGPMVMMGRVTSPLTINGKAMDMKRIDERVKVGATEIWEIENVSPMAHPFHIHDIQFLMLDRNGAPPPAHERGLKDTVLVRPGETVRIIAKFEDYADPNNPYMYHCHILDHEDWGMMGQFVVEA